MAGAAPRCWRASAFAAGRRCCTDKDQDRLAWDRLLKGCPFNAEQSQPPAAPPHPEDEVSGEELGGVRCRTSASRQFDVMGDSRSAGWLAGGSSDYPWRAVQLLRACHRNG